MGTGTFGVLDSSVSSTRNAVRVWVLCSAPLCGCKYCAQHHCAGVNTVLSTTAQVGVLYISTSTIEGNTHSSCFFTGPELNLVLRAYEANFLYSWTPTFSKNSVEEINHLAKHLSISCVFLHWCKQLYEESDKESLDKIIWHCSVKKEVLRKTNISVEITAWESKHENMNSSKMLFWVIF